MLDFLLHLWDTSGFPARWNCAAWTAAHGWLHILSDLGVWSAYVAIPCVLGYFVLRRRDIPFRMIFCLFGAFILACGTTHLMEAIIFWWPAYRLAGVIKLFTALVSWGTVIALIPVTPKALAMRSPMELEKRVRERTAELARANEELQEEIRERQRAAAALRESEQRFRQLADAMPQIVWTARPDGYLDYYNRRWYEFTGLPPGQGGDDSWKPVLHPDDVDRGLATWYDAVRAGRPYQIEYRFKDRSTGGYRWHLGRALPVQDEAGRIVRWYGTCTDIDDQKRAEEALRSEVAQRQAAQEQLRQAHDELEVKIQKRTAELRQVNARLQQSLEEKEILLKEIHHRVKNNLQVISSLLQLQAQHTADPATLQMFRDSQDRVRSMALVHERLYRSHDFGRVNVADYVTNLTSYLFRSYQVDAERITLDIDVHEVQLSIDAAVPCGLLLNELVSNCLKHAFRGKDRGCIRIELCPVAEGAVRLCVQDNGMGLPEQVRLGSTESFGLQLVMDLVEQLHGTIEVERQGGTIVRIVFPEA